MQIAPFLKLGRGVTALIGGGGKTTLLLTLARELSARGRVIVAASAKMYPPPGIPLIAEDDAERVREALRTERVVCVGTPCAEGKLTAPALPFSALASLADFVLAEADGSRGLPFKAHAPHEPVIPPEAQRVVLVVGADGFGRPIAEVCHRSARYAALAGADESACVTPELAARVLRAEGLGDRIFVNKVESAERYEAAARLAELLGCPVTAGSLKLGVYECLR